MNKKDFPIFKDSAVVFLDTSASAQKPNCVIDTMHDLFCQKYANVHRGNYLWANQVTELYEKSRQKVARFLNTDTQNIIWTKGATDGINLIASVLSETLSAGDEIIITLAEHHSNFVPWQQLAFKKELKIHYINVLNDGSLDMMDFKNKLSSKTKIVAITVLSNVLGVEFPVKKVVEMSHQVGAKVLVDACQSIIHSPIDVADLDCDFLTFSGHKIYGPTGIGVLFAKSEIMDNLTPYQMGGDMVDRVSLLETTFQKSPLKYEAGTQPIVEVIGLSRAIEYVESIGYEQIRSHEESLMKDLIGELSQIDGFTPIGDNLDIKKGLISFNIDRIHSSDIAELLGQQNICIRQGLHCAEPLHRRFGFNSSLRVSFGIYNDESDIFALKNGLIKAIKILG